MKQAFTLAEVLITLLIIGIVAALTIPSVMSNYQQQEFKTGLKKAVSVLNEAIQTNIAQEGETPYENEDMFAYLQRHMSVLKTGYLDTCNMPVAEGENCTSRYITNKVFYTTDGMRFETTGMGFRNNIYLHETGFNVALASRPCILQPNCTSSGQYYCGSYGLSNNTHDTKYSPCVVAVDVNGDKKPNPPQNFTSGNQPFLYTYPLPSDKKINDMFLILITDEKAIPFGVVAQRAMYSSK